MTQAKSAFGMPWFIETKYKSSKEAPQMAKPGGSSSDLYKHRLTITAPFYSPIAYPLKGDYALLEQSDFVHHHAAFDPIEQSQEIERHLKAALSHAEKISEICEKCERIEAAIEELAKKIDKISSHGAAILVPIESLAPEAFEITWPATAVIAPVEGGFEASLYSAGIFASGDTQEEAFENLKAVMLDAFETLESTPDSKLGPGPLKQKRVLETIVRRTDA